MKDVETELLTRPESEREALRKATKFGVFVVHNKLKPKLAELPADLPYVPWLFIVIIRLTSMQRYYSGADVEDLWLDYPWEAVYVLLASLTNTDYISLQQEY
jgi:hypothetical protein